MKSVLAADWGGTKCRFALVTERREVLCVQRVATPASYGELLRESGDAFRRIRDELPDGVEPPPAVGIGTAGAIRGDGSIAYSPNVPIEGRPLRDDLAAAVGLPATVINDGRASALGEYLHGHAAGKDPLVVIFYGTGIGIGMIVGGEPYAGATNAAGEIGHTVHVHEGRRCSCGRKGCYEAYCGGGPIATRAAEELGRPAGGKDGWRIDDILALVDERPEAAAIVRDAEVAAGAMVASLCTLLNPAAVVLGGGVLEGWPGLRERVEAYTRRWCAPIVKEELEFVRSLGESDSILWGAAAATGRLWRR